MKFFSHNTIKSTSQSKTSTKGYFMHMFSAFFLIFSLILNIFISPAVAHAGFFSSLMADISGSVSNLGPNQAIADDVTSSTSSSTDSTGMTSGDGNDDQNNVLVAAVNPDLTPIPDCSVPTTNDNTISSEIDPCSVATTTNTQISTYVVRSGDTLSEIAGLFGVSVNTIVWMNNLDRTVPLQAGETLVILPVSGIQYTIKKGDSVQNIASHYGVDQQDILQYNDIDLTSTLNPGDTIIIPDATLDGIQSPPSGSNLSGSGSSKSKGHVPAKSRWGAPGTEPAHNTNGPYYPGYYALPLVHGIETQGIHGYNAVDLAAPKGTPILASANGIVIISIQNGGWNGGYGNYVVINHPNGTQTLYAHMSKVLVTNGESVTQGEAIGLVGKTGEATGPHVHFEIRGARNPFGDLTSW